jgi:hypothetical protein
MGVDKGGAVDKTYRPVDKTCLTPETGKFLLWALVLVP